MQSVREVTPSSTIAYDASTSPYPLNSNNSNTTTNNKLSPAPPRQQQQQQQQDSGDLLRESTDDLSEGKELFNVLNKNKRSNKK
jgi:hypothetical protein